MSRVFLYSSVFAALCIACLMFYLQNSDTFQLQTIDIITAPQDYSHNIPRCMNKETYKNIKNELNRSLSRIWSDWDIGNYPLFLSFMHIPADSWAMQKHKFILLLLQHQEYNHHSKNGSNKYVMGFSGSSVTAGHDSYFTEAYPNVVYEAMRRVFEAANIELEVRNQALGNNPCYPYDACVATHMVFHSNLHNC